MNRTDREALGAGTLGDDQFDALLPEHARTKSQGYWTPLSVAQLAARRLSAHGVRSVLDVGCGVGKFCVAAAVAYPHVEWTGIDRRAALIDDAKVLASRVGVDNVRFLCGDAFEVAWGRYDGFYFFNPFSENLVESHDRLDGSVELSLARYLGEVRRVEYALRALRPGTLLATYHGIGGPIPSNYELLLDEAAGSNRVRTWRKTTTPDAQWVHVETDGGIYCATSRQLERALSRW